MRTFYVFLAVLCLVGCSQTSTEQNSSDVVYVNVEGVHYLDAWELALIDTDGLTEFGQVERAALIPAGAPVYEIAGYPDRNVIAVKAPDDEAGPVTSTSGFQIYVRHGTEGNFYYPDIDDQPFEQIEIYKGRELLRKLDGEEAKAFLSLFNEQGPHNEFLYETGTDYTVVLIGDGALGRNYRIKEADGHYGLTHIESRLPDGIGTYFE